MAGDIYSIHGPTRFAAADEPKLGVGPAKQVTEVSLRSSDGKVFLVKWEAAAISGRLRKLAQQGLLEGEIEMPMDKDVVSKLVEYMEYHEANPPGEIKIPLESDNLAECGALKWDVGFITVDKDMVFQLLLVAIVEDIPSLMYLASARAHLMLKGRSRDKLCKEFALTNDIPHDEDDEYQQLSAGFATAMGKQRIRPEAQGLYTVATALWGMIAAAEKHGMMLKGPAVSAPSDDASALEAGTEIVETGIDLKSMRHQSWRAIVLQDWQQLAEAPDEIRGDRDLVLACTSASSGRILGVASESLRADRAVVLEAVRAGGACFREASDDLRSDRDFVLEAIVASDGTALGGAADSLRGDKELMLEAAKKGRGAAMKGALPSLQRDKAFVLECTAADPEAVKYADAELRIDRDFALEAVRVNGIALRFLPPKFQADHEIVQSAVSENAAALGFAHTSRRADLGANLPQDSGLDLMLQKREQDAAGVGKPSQEALNPTHWFEGVTLSQYRDYRSKPAPVGVAEQPWIGQRVQKYVQFTAFSTPTGNMGQSNYTAANSFLDKIMFYERPEIDGVGLMWGAVGGIGMRWKAFASQDFIQKDSLLTINESRAVLWAMATMMDPPEWAGANLFSDEGRAIFLTVTSGFGTGGGYKPGEDALISPSLPSGAKIAADGWQKKAGDPAAASPAVRPLSSWPGLVAEEELQEGTRVRLIGCGGKDGTTGVLIKLTAVGRKWKVKLDEDRGHALLPAQNLVPLPPPREETAPLAPAAKPEAAPVQSSLPAPAPDGVDALPSPPPQPEFPSQEQEQERLGRYFTPCSRMRKQTGRQGVDADGALGEDGVWYTAAEWAAWAGEAPPVPVGRSGTAGSRKAPPAPSAMDLEVLEEQRAREEVQRRRREAKAKAEEEARRGSSGTTAPRPGPAWMQQQTAPPPAFVMRVNGVPTLSCA